MKRVNDWDRLQDDSRDLWTLSRKLESLAALLERQTELGDGFVELVGLGMILSDASSELDRVSTEIEEIRLQLFKEKGENTEE